MKPTAKKLVLELLTAADPHQGSVANLVAAGELFGIDEGSTRVALARLVAAGTLELVERGEYRLGRETRALTEQVTSWRELERQVRKWDGGWACVQLGDLQRSDRSALRRRERALRLHGFRELGRGLEVRPDNLAGGIEVLRARLVELGLPAKALVFRASDFDAATEKRARALWDDAKLTQTYRQTTARIEKFLEAADQLTPKAAARETFAFGSDVLRLIMFDPRLPEPLVDVAARKALVEAMKQLDLVGRKRWVELFGVPKLPLPAKGKESHVYS